MTSVFLTRLWPDAVLSRLATAYTIVVNENALPLTALDFSAAAQKFEIICPTVADRIEDSMFKVPLLKTKLLANYGVGFDHIDVCGFLDDRALYS